MIIRQSAALTWIFFGMLFSRPLKVSYSIISIALVIFVLLSFLSISEGFRSVGDASGSATVGVIISDGARSETQSGITFSDQNQLEAELLRLDMGSTSIISPERQIVVPRKLRDGRDAGLLVRGIRPPGVDLREGMTIIEGRVPEAGTREIMVGVRLAAAYPGLSVGNSVRLGPETWTVVGRFSLKNSVYESEAWADLDVMNAVFPAEPATQTLRFGQIDAGELFDAAEAIDNLPAINYRVVSERQLFAAQSGRSTDLILRLGWPLSIIMAIGAIAGAANTMSYNVSSRRRETATLKTLGYRGTAILTATLIESAIIALLGGVCGLIVAFLVFDGVTATALGGDFARTVFSLEVTYEVAVRGIGLALVIGLLAALGPALGASRTPTTSTSSVT